MASKEQYTGQRRASGQSAQKATYQPRHARGISSRLAREGK